jgi:hypothetical protein
MYRNSSPDRAFPAIMIQLEVDQGGNAVVVLRKPRLSQFGHDKAVIGCFMHQREACVKMRIGWVIGAARGDWEAAHPRQKRGEATAQETLAT